MFDLLKDQDPDAIALPCLLKLGVFTFCPTQKLVSLSSVALADRSHRDDLSSKVKDLFNASDTLNCINVNDGLCRLWIPQYQY